uniref:CSON004128 protein n=1 Tax=Culicoides sonorensis TaxID=179676 RepID=A0A336N0X7_CULSO
MEQQQLFCLRWNNHPSNLTGCLSRLLKNEALCDVTIVCSDRKFLAHQTILSACSPYLEEIFLNNKTPHPIVYMIGVGASEMAALLDFMYQGEANVAQRLLQKFLHTATLLQVRGLTDHDSMSFKQEDNDIENNNINNNDTSPKFTTQSVPPPSYDSDRETTDKDSKEDSEQTKRKHDRDDLHHEEDRVQLTSRRSASDQGRESSTTPVDLHTQSSSASLSSYPINQKKARTVCDTPNLPVSNTPERRRSETRLPSSLGSQKLSPNSKMDTSDLDDGRRISPVSNASRDHMPLKPDIDLPGMAGLQHILPPQLLPPNLPMHEDNYGGFGMQPSLSDPPSEENIHPIDHPDGPDGERSLMHHHALMASRGHHVLNLSNNNVDLDSNGQSNGSSASSRRDHNIDYSALFVQLIGTFPTLYRCVTCHKTVSNRWHHANIHRPQSHECPICGQKFTRRDNMKAHCKVKHADLKDRYYGHYAWHMRLTFERLSGGCNLHRCKLCGKVVTHIRNHYHVHFPGRFECPLCRATYTRSDNLRTHCKFKHPMFNPDTRKFENMLTPSQAVAAAALNALNNTLNAAAAAQHQQTSHINISNNNNNNSNSNNNNTD